MGVVPAGGRWDRLVEELPHLSSTKRGEVMAALGKREYLACAESPLYWLDDTLHIPTAKYPTGLPYVYTKDPHKMYTCNLCGTDKVEALRVAHLELEHGHENASSLQLLNKTFTLLPAIRPFPFHPYWEYIAPITEVWQSSQYFALEKSRDMSATWLMIALFTWDAMFHNGRQHIFQSEDAFKTLELVQRAHIIYSNTPKFLRDAIGPGNYSKGSTKSGELYFPKGSSEILGFPQGADQIRQFHPTGVFADEAAFQVEAGESFAAIKPAIMMGGRYAAISSANPSWFELICRDKTDE